MLLSLFYVQFVAIKHTQNGRLINYSSTHLFSLVRRANVISPILFRQKVSENKLFSRTSLITERLENKYYHNSHREKKRGERGVSTRGN